MVTAKDISKMAKVEADTPDIDYGKGEYPLATMWNEFVKKVEEARDVWTTLQEEISIVGEKELEVRYPVLAQKHLGRFRKVKFEWMVGLFVDYYRGAGGLDAMYINLPLGEKENTNDSRKD